MFGEYPRVQNIDWRNTPRNHFLVYQVTKNSLFKCDLAIMDD